VKCIDLLHLNTTLLLVEGTQSRATALPRIFSRLTITPSSTSREYPRTKWNKLKKVSLRLEDASKRNSEIKTNSRNTLSITLTKTKMATYQSMNSRTF
jgi:hypothetical protein